MTPSTTAISDPYPANIEIEIDREQLGKYLCASSLLGLSVFGSLIGFAVTMIGIEAALKRGPAMHEFGLMIFRHTGAGIAFTLLGICLAHFFINRPLARRYAARLKVAVEGSFLHIFEQRAMLIDLDRKLHFRAIVDYATVQGFLMRRFGLHTLRMSTTAGGQFCFVTIPGVKDCLRIRDMLSDIDRLREN